MDQTSVRKQQRRDRLTEELRIWPRKDLLFTSATTGRSYMVNAADSAGNRFIIYVFKENETGNFGIMHCQL